MTIKPNPTAIREALDALFDTSDVVELRAFPKGGKKRTDAGYFDSAHWDQLVADAVQLNERGAAVYVTLNPVTPQLLGRYNNRIEPFATATTTDKQILRRRWLLIDLDPKRPAMTSATQAQLDAAKNTATAIYKHLASLGWPAPIVAESGNGYHLLVAIDMTNDAESSDILKGVLNALGDMFDNEHVQVDRGVFNAGRICKLYGTVANKGDDTTDSPWRLSSIVKASERQVVSVEQLRMLHAAPSKPSHAGKSAAPTGEFRLEEFFAKHGIEYTPDMHDGRERFKLARCPFNAEHVKGESAVFRDGSGKLGFKCLHNSCADKGWVALRELFDGPPEQRGYTTTPPLRFGTKEPATTEWESPIAIQNNLIPAPEFDAKVLLPQVLADFVLDEADRMPCSPDYVAVSLMVSIGAVIGAGCAVKPKRRDDWLVVPNLWGGVIGDPSSKKTPALGVPMRFIDRLEAQEAAKLVEARKVYEAEMAAYEAQQSAVKTEMKKAASSSGSDPFRMASAMDDFANLDVPEEPHARRYKTNDASIEKLCDIEARNPNGLMVFRDELMGLLASWEKEGHDGDRAFYLEGWNGTGSYNSDRIGRGEQFVKTHCLSILGGIQPDKLETYLSDIASNLDNDGRIQRFQLLVYPNPVEWEWRDRYPVQGAREAVRDVFDRLASFDPLQDGAHPPNDFVRLPFFYFDDAAQEVFIEWCTALHKELIPAEENPLMRQHLGKFEKLFCSLALILHLAEGNIGDVKVDSALRAAAWCDYLADHARRVYGMVEGARVSTANMLLRRIREGKLPNNFTVRDVRRKNWGGATSNLQIEGALAVLETNNWIRGHDTQSGVGRQTTVYELRPELRGGQ
jgi:hypothetical protein